MISDNQPHTYKDQGRKFYAFFENYEWISDEKTIKGFHFYIFDQEGFCWDSCTNPSRKYIKDKSHGFFLDRPAWEADGLPCRLPLEAYEYLDDNVDSAYALESLYQMTGLDFALILKTPQLGSEMQRQRTKD